MLLPCGFHWFVDLFLERKGTLDKKLVLLLTLEGACMSFHMNSVSSAGNNVCVCTQSRLTPCNPMDCSPPGSSVHGILQARILEWVAIPSSRGSSQPRNRTGISCICRQILYQLSYQGRPQPPAVPQSNSGLSVSPRNASTGVFSFGSVLRLLCVLFPN